LGDYAGTVTECVPSVEVKANGEMQFNFTWAVDLTDEYPYVRKRSDEGNTSMFLVDNLGNRYDHIQVGGAAAQDVYMHDGDIAEGWFLFPRAK
jgi:hypothetical protein